LETAKRKQFGKMQAMAPTLFSFYMSKDVDFTTGHNIMMLR
jgi:hypothetical protein